MNSVDFDKLYSMQIQVSKEPTEESIINIIEFVKNFEKLLGRNDTDFKLKRYYGKRYCNMLASLIKKTYFNYNDVEIVCFRPKNNDRELGVKCHYAVKFKDDFYDIYGKRNLQQMKSFCEDELALHDLMLEGCKVTKENYDSGEFSLDEPLQFCLSRIKRENLEPNLE